MPRDVVIHHDNEDHLSQDASLTSEYGSNQYDIEGCDQCISNKTLFLETMANLERGAPQIMTRINMGQQAGRYLFWPTLPVPL